MNENIAGKTVVITGGSSGIGEVTARHLARAGANLMLSARSEDKLKALKDELGDRVHYQKADVTRRDDVERLFKSAKERFGAVDVIINNAGIMPLSPLAAAKVDEWDKMIDTNIKGVLYGIASALPDMLGRESGHIINLSSVAGHVSFPSGAVYCATKYAVRAISEALRKETAGKIRVTIISPGAVGTALTETITHQDTKEFVEELYEDAISPDAIARAICYAIAEPDDVGVNEILIRPKEQEL
ncbi:MAG: SDR family oxidoreductase [Deltaproteobacteria bacterium]